MPYDRLSLDGFYLLKEKNVPDEEINVKLDVSSQVDNATKWTRPEIARLGAVAGDIVALLDPEPFSTAALSYGSDLVNFGADMAEGVGMLPALGSLASNALLSTFAVIPGIGQAIGSSSKIVREITKLSPKIMKTVLVAGGIGIASNMNEINASLRKLSNWNSDSNMDANDWRNILSGIQFVLGGALAVKNSGPDVQRTMRNIKKLPTDSNDKGYAYMVSNNVRTADEDYEIQFCDMKSRQERSVPELAQKLMDAQPNTSQGETNKIYMQRFVNGQMHEPEIKGLVNAYKYEDLQKIELELNPDAFEGDIHILKNDKYLGKLISNHLQEDLNLILRYNHNLKPKNKKQYIKDLIESVPIHTSILPFDRNGDLFYPNLGALGV